MKTLIRNCHLISPDVDSPGASIEIEGPHIRAVYQDGEALPETEAVFEAEGQMALPGFIDMHFHGAMGFHVDAGTQEAVETVAGAKLREGVTTMLPTTTALPHAQLLNAAQAIAAYFEEPHYPKFAGLHAEGPFLNPNCAGAQNPDFVRLPDMAELQELNQTTKIAIVSLAIELEGALPMVRELCEMGIVPACAHSSATYEQFKAAKEAGLRHLTHFCNQMSRLHHREIGLLGAGLMDDDILLEVICDGIHLCPDMIRLVFKTRSVDRIALVTDSVMASWYEDGTYELAGLGIRVEDGVVRLVSNGALAGSSLKMNDALKNVHEFTGLSLSQLVKTTSLNQAQSLGLEDIGRIRPGFIADIVILNDDFTPVAVFADGEQRLPD